MGYNREEDLKNLHFHELCRRLPYGLIGRITIDVTSSDIDMEGFHIEEPMDVDVILTDININGEIRFMAYGGASEDLAYLVQEWSEYGFLTYEDFKPYLRSMVSMTDEKENEFQDENNYEIPYTLYGTDWLDEHMFDYRGLIDFGKALEAKEGMYDKKGGTD